MAWIFSELKYLKVEQDLRLRKLLDFFGISRSRSGG